MIAAEIGPDLRLLTTDILRNRKFFQYYHRTIICFVLSFKFPCIYYLIHIIDVIADFSSFYSMIRFKNTVSYVPARNAFCIAQSTRTFFWQN